MIHARRFVELACLAALFLAVPFAAGVVVFFFGWAPEADAPPTVIIEAAVPGANASAVEQTIATLIEQQVNGVEHLAQLHSHSRRDGSYRLIVSFAARTDVNLALVLVQNRVALAMPVLPTETQTLGVTIRKQSPDPLLFITLFSPDGRFDASHLANYATAQLKDELARLPGVAKVSIVGREDFPANISLGPEKPAVCNVTFDGMPTEVLAVYSIVPARPREASAGVQARLSELRRRFPEGLDAFTGFDFSREPRAEAPGYLVLDVDPPVGASVEMIGSLLSRGDQLLRRLPGVQNVLALSEQPFDRDHDQPCLVVCLGRANGAPVDRERLIREIRRVFHQTFIVTGQAANVRVRDLSGAARSRQFGYPIDFAICGPQRPRVQELAGQLVARMSQDPGLTDVWADLRTAPSLAVDIDKAKAASLGLALRREVEPSHLERIDLLPAVTITATLAGGLTQAQARSVCERLAAEVLPKQGPSEYRLVWPRGSGTPSAR
jgi:multidrug efflux pump subunit AcrB